MLSSGNDSTYLLRDPGRRGEFRPSRRAGAEMLATVAPDNSRLFRVAPRTIAADSRYGVRYPPYGRQPDGIAVRAIVLRSVPRFASCCLLAINEACASKRSAWMAVYVDTASRADGRSEVVDALRLEFRVPDHRVD